MPEQDLNPAAAKFISSLVKSLQILCNGQVEFSESIELVGHINVRVDHKYKFDYIVDEQVSKEGEDSATTFLSNSYHSSPPSKQLRKKPSQSELDQDIMFSEISQNIHGKSRQSKVNHDSLVQSHEFCSEDTLVSGEESCPNFSVAVDSPNRQGSQTNQMVVKLEEDDDSNDCMVLPASPGDYEPVGEVIGEGFPSIGPSASFEESQSNQVGRTRKRRQPPEQGTDDRNDNKVKWERKFSTDVMTTGLQCPFCHQGFSHSDQLLAHKYTCQYSPSQIPFSLSSIQSSYLLPSFAVDTMACTMCGEVFHNSRDRLKHMNMSHGVCVYPCHSCDEIFGSSRMLFQHKKSEHGDGVVQLECPQCGKTFTTALNLRGHMNMHKGIRPYKCLKCGEAFAYSQSKHRHQKLCNK